MAGDYPLHLVDQLIDGAIAMEQRLLASWLRPLGFQETDVSGVERLVVDPNGQVHHARHRFVVWQSPHRGRFVWFRLESDIPHMSTIVACVATPVEAVECPMFVMNLNLKLKANTFNTIMGFRGTAEHRRPFGGWLHNPGPGVDVSEPALVKPNPDGFDGVRSMFWLETGPVGWGLSTAERCLDRWFTAVAAVDAPSVTPLSDDPDYANEMAALHGREGGVYDAVFGEGWLSGLFTDRVFSLTR
jgi:hypothetical protein